MYKLRDYQVEVYNKVIENHSRGLSSIVHLESGLGKSFVLARLAKFYEEQGLDVVVLVPSVEVRQQIKQRITEVGSKVPVLSSLLLLNRLDEHINVDVFLVDEAHHSAADSYVKLFDKYPKAIKVGFSATPIRSDNKSLANIYDCIVDSDMTTAQAIKEGYLSPFIYYAPSNSDIANHSISKDKLEFDGLKFGIGTSNTHERVVYGDVISTWQKYGKGYQTVLFAPNVTSSKEYAVLFRKRGIKAESIDSSMPRKDVDKIIKDYRKGKITVLCNFNIISEGFDMKEVDCVILTATTMSYSLFYQRAYRALRKNGNRHAIVLDHGDNASVHGMIDVVKEYTLIETEEDKEKKEREEFFDRIGSDWAFEEVRGVSLEEVYRYGEGYNSKYDKIIEKANELHNFNGFILLVGVQNELNIVSAPGEVSWAYAYARSKGYEGIPAIEG